MENYVLIDRIFFRVGRGSPAKESATQTPRSEPCNETPAAKIVAPPRQTPHSMKSPGTLSARTLSINERTFSRRRRPTIVSASNGQSSPVQRGCSATSSWRVPLSRPLARRGVRVRGVRQAPCQQCQIAIAQILHCGVVGHDSSSLV